MIQKRKKLKITKKVNVYRNIVFNYSSLVIKGPKLKLKNRGLKFSLLPYKLDIAQTLVEF